MDDGDQMTHRTCGWKQEIQASPSATVRREDVCALARRVCACVREGGRGAWGVYSSKQELACIVCGACLSWTGLTDSSLVFAGSAPPQ